LEADIFFSRSYPSFHRRSLLSPRHRYRHSKDVGGEFEVSTWFFPAVFHRFDAQMVVAIYASLARLIALLYSIRLLFAAGTLGSVQTFPYFHPISYSPGASLWFINAHFIAQQK